jgi:general secretion pathway protein G
MRVRLKILSLEGTCSMFTRARREQASTECRIGNGEIPMSAFLQLRGRRCAYVIGFTLIELLVVMAILAMLLSVAAPRYFQSVERAKEATLKTDLRLLRDAIDKYRADVGQFPDSLQKLVDARYLRNLPVDPVTNASSDWVLVPHPDGVTAGVYDLRSGAVGVGIDGTAFASW